jgi:prepilin-type N-terminal cleavage/methylation domain-containing protein
MTRKGFTLIELLVVIVIIGILVAIALPNFIRIKDKAKEAEVKQNCHAIQLALERYAVDSPGDAYPFIIMGGDWTDSYVVWINWVALQSEDGDPQTMIDKISNPERRANWVEADTDVGDPLVMEAYMPSYPGNPFLKTKSDTLLPRIHHYPFQSPQVVCDPYWRIVGGRMSNKMYEVFGPIWIIWGNDASIAGDAWVHHIFNNPPYNFEGDIFKTPPGGWTSPSGNNMITGCFSYWPRGEKNTCWSITGASDVLGYTLAGYGSVRTAGQDVYNRNGNYKGRFRTEPCEIDCPSGGLIPDVPCICPPTDAMPSIDRNNGGSDTVVDGVIITLDSGVDKKSSRVNVGITEGESAW